MISEKFLLVASAIGFTLAIPKVIYDAYLVFSDPKNEISISDIEDNIIHDVEIEVNYWFGSTDAKCNGSFMHISDGSVMLPVKTYKGSLVCLSEEYKYRTRIPLEVVLHGDEWAWNPLSAILISHEEDDTCPHYKL